MKDKELETKLRLLTFQLDSWKRLHDLITYGLDKAKPIISSEQERQFTEIRSNLLQETEHVFKKLNVLGELSGKAMNVLQRASSVRGVRELTNDEIRRMETEWNRVFTKLGVVQGQLKGTSQRFGRANICWLSLEPPLGAAAPLLTERQFPGDEAPQLHAGPLLEDVTSQKKLVFCDYLAAATPTASDYCNRIWQN